jgi:hypothetical protein
MTREYSGMTKGHVVVLIGSEKLCRQAGRAVGASVVFWANAEKSRAEPSVASSLRASSLPIERRKHICKRRIEVACELRQQFYKRQVHCAFIQRSCPREQVEVVPAISL